MWNSDLEGVLSTHVGDKTVSNMIRRIAPDKWRHFLVGILMGAILEAALLWLWPQRVLLITVLAFMIVLAISYGFELFSKITGKGHYDFIDAVASAIGGIIGLGSVLAIALAFLFDHSR